MKIGLKVFCFLLLAACAGCVPHYDRYAPEIEGSVLRDGQPVAGAAIELAVGTMNSITQTDAAGKFKVGPLERFGIMLYGDAAGGYAIYTLTIQQDGKTYVGLHAPNGYTSDPAQIECDLSAPPRSLWKEDQYCVVKRFVAPGMSTNAGE